MLNVAIAMFLSGGAMTWEVSFSLIPHQENATRPSDGNPSASIWQEWLNWLVILQKQRESLICQ